MNSRNIISINDISDGDISRLFFVARSPSRIKKVDRSEPSVVMTAFFEPSTRTRLSFEMAAIKAGANILSFHSESSALKKGETEFETIENLASMGPQIMVIRSSISHNKEALEKLGVCFINGGDGKNEHPSQALLDCFTLVNAFKADDLSGKHILIIGDVEHSRVAHSNLLLMKRLGAKVSTLSPKAWSLTKDWGQNNVYHSYDDITDKVDAVMCLRIQKERMDSSCQMSDTIYREKFGLNLERLKDFGEACFIMHPGPMNLGLEIERDVAIQPRSLILQQVKNGVEVRRALVESIIS